MLISITTKKRFKVIAMFLAVNLLAQIGFPTAAFALTSGPSQPEAGSFEPVNTNQMVDLFSGDFTYNIPLMNVPGPNGGYPINLAYHAGIGMEQEATWVGLGWNINAGVINRNLRGIPDDFNGDPIKKTVHMKPQRRISIGVSAELNTEIFGADLGKGRDFGGAATIYYDNYRGVGLNYGISLSTSALQMGKTQMAGSLNINSDSKEGLGVSPSLSLSTAIRKQGFKFEGGLDINSRQGLNKFTFSAKTREYEDYTLHSKAPVIRKFGKTSVHGAGVSFSSSTYVPGLTMPQGGFGVSVNMKFGVDFFGTDSSPLSLNASYNQTGISQNVIDFGGYGYLYEHNNNRGHSIADFNREKDIAVNKNSKSLPIPSATYDVYAVKGQGVGGAFRTYRSDIGVFKDPNIRGHTTGFQGGLEFNAGAGVKVGGNIALSYSTSYSGEWQTHGESVTDDYKRFGNTVDSDFEPAYFKALGETVPSNSMAGGVHNNNDDPFNFEMGMAWHWASFSRVPVVRQSINYNGSGINISGSPKTNTRQKRVQSIQYLTNEELNGFKILADPIVGNRHSFTNTYGSNYLKEENYTYNNVDHHIGEMSVVNPDGNRYVYGLPAYNNKQVDKTFAVNDDTSPSRPADPSDPEIFSKTFDRVRNYKGVNDDPGNDEGLTNLYSATEMPAYAHSYMLTEVLSPDYVDLGNNGPSDDDLGYWVRFNYIKKSSDFKWRAPYGEKTGNNIEGKLSNPMDDMSGYSYGEKEIKYLESIETKTHVAEYYLSDRSDGKGVTGPDGVPVGSPELLQLDSIVLRSKAEISKAIKTVHFSYDYELCEGTPNSTGGNQGKLTLKKVWFTYLDNSIKGALSPYEFDYTSVVPNPDYDLNKMDRWGNYQAEGPFTSSSTAATINNQISPNQNTPYCNQFKNSALNTSYTNYTDTERADDASAWNLSQVIMPSGGVLNISYESDDYAYVQDRPAMNMFKILGTGNASTGYSALRDNLGNGDNRIYFELNKPMTSEELDACVAGIDQVYFKAYMKLKDQFQSYGFLDDEANDYVEGYTKFNGNYGFDPTSSNTRAWIEVPMVPPHQLIQATIHPIKMAGLREIRFNRVDLLAGQNTGMGALQSIGSMVTVVPTVINTVMDAMQMITGFYNYGIMAGWCDKLIFEDDFPSYIRLNTGDGIKYGGGCRVESVALNDDWSELNGQGLPNSNYEGSIYGQEYDYRLPDGRSSGVAEYEPLIGGEENPFRRPVRYSSDRMFIKDDALMIEEPYNESLFPSANVGYSRVTVKNIKQIDGVGSDVDKAVSGITVNEFYTARDYPVYADNKTGVDYEGYNLSIPIPFIGSYNFHNNGYSQGYSIELNNMHGKPYSVATYAPPVNPTDPQPGAPGVAPVAATYYYYKTQGGFVRNKTGGNKLDNMVNVLSGDAIVTPVNIGKQLDTYVDMRENKTTATSIGGGVNLNYLPPFAVTSTFFLSIDQAMSMFRSVTTNKVITRNGILDKQVTTKEGAKTITQNLYYDGETGAPLLTTTTNDFDAPIYDYSFAAHWEHEGMGGAYQNVGAKVTLSSALLHKGDEILDLSNNTKYWVESVDPTVVTKADGGQGYPSGPNFKIIRSGYRNQQSVPSGNIIALTNPADASNRNYPLFTTINNLIFTQQPTQWGNFIPYTGTNTFKDCFNNGVNDPIYTVNTIAIINNNNNEYSGFEISGPGETFCNGRQTIELNFDNYIDFTDSLVFDVTTMVLSKHGNRVKAVDGNGEIIWGDIVGAECLNECIPDVLHASSAKFKDDWNIDYADAGVNSITPTASNTTRYGSESIWRLHETYLFDIDRKQSDLLAGAPANPNQTQNGVDGTYQNFALFNWDPACINNLWTKTNTINQYSPYGYELENEDALGIKSSALYGYNNSVVTAVASNTAYKELVFDGFEDYGASYTNTVSNNGHFSLSTTAGTFTPPILSTSESHSGNTAIKIDNFSFVEYENVIGTTAGGITNKEFTPIENEEYYISAWVKVTGFAGIGSATLTVDVNGSNVLSKTTSNNEQKIEGWQRIEGEFTTSSAGDPIIIKISGGNTEVYLDDIRIQPFKSAMKTYVYDTKTLWLKAELDDRNYATFYNYDEEGNLVQIKKETKDGIRTIVSNRKNVKRNESAAQ